MSVFLASMLNRPCVVAHEADVVGKDDYNNDIVERALHETVCALQQRQRDEASDRGDISRTTWLLVLPAGTPIGAGSAVTVGTEEYEVHGDPWTVYDEEKGTPSHIEATVVQTRGTGPDPAGS